MHQQIGLTPGQEQQMESELAAGTNAKLAQDGEQINNDITAALAQENAQTETAAGSSSFAQQASLTDNLQLANPEVQLQSVNISSIPLPQLPYVVGNEGTQGYWGVARSILGQGASNADIQNEALQLMTANPGVTTLHQGDVLNSGNGQISSAAEQTYSAMNQSYQESQLQPIAVSVGPISPPSEASGPVDTSGSGYGNMAFAGMPSGPMGMPNPIAGLEDIANEVNNTFNGAMNSIESLGNWVGNGLSSAYHAFDSSFLKEGQTYAVNAQLSIINSIDPNDHSLAAEYARAQAYENMGTAMAAPTNYADITMQAASILPIGALGRGAEVVSEGEQLSEASLSSFPEITARTTAGGQTISAVVKPVDIIPGDPTKIAIIGRNMDAVNPYADALSAQGYTVNTFSSEAGTIPDSAVQEFEQLKELYGGEIPNAALVNSEMFSADVSWAQGLKAQGYTILDLGNPFANPKASVFYNAERLATFGQVYR